MMYTKGPWLAAEAVSSIVGLPVVTSGEKGGRVICNVNCASDPLHGKVPGDDAFNREALANARLIASAPKLLLSLRKLIEAIYASADLQEHANIAKLLVDAETVCREASE